MNDYGRRIQKSAPEYIAHTRTIRLHRAAYGAERVFTVCARYFLVAFVLAVGGHGVRYWL